MQPLLQAPMPRLLALCCLFLFVPLTFAQDVATEGPASRDPAANSVFARDTFRIDSLVCPFKGDIDYEPGEIECGLLQVPENRENPDSRFIELHFVKLNSTWDDDEEDGGENKEDEEVEWSTPEPGKRDDPVIYLSGGPGSHATYYVERFKDHGILKHRDMYILEQRGVGYSDDFCPNYGGRKPGKFNVETYAEQQLASLEASDDCRINALAGGVDLSGYNTIENARDVHALRRALDIEQWNMWGISYGTILGQAYIRQDPGGIRAIVLDSIVPINAQAETHYWQVVKWYDRDLQKLDELCQAQPGCAKRYPELGQRLRQAASMIIDNPITVEVKDTEVFPSGQTRVFQDIAAFLPFIMLYEQTNYPGLPGMIYAWADLIESRDEVFFKGLAAAAGDSFGGSSQGMYDAIFCTDGYRKAQIEANAADREAFPVLGSVFGSEEIDKKIAQRCRELGMPPRDAAEYAPVATDIPSLIVAGDMDPVTPPPLAKAILPGFTNATYVEFPFAGHGPLRSVECGGDLLNLFYDNPKGEPDLTCVDQMEAPEFHTPLYRTAIAPRMLQLAVEDKKKLAIPGAWGGVSVLVSLIAFVFLTVAPIGRFIDKRQPVAVAGARWFAWLAATMATAAAVVIGTAAAVTAEESELLAAFGLVPWARYGAIAGVLAGIFGIAAIVQTIRTRRTKTLPIGTLIGFVITGLAAMGFSSFLLYWDLGPF